MNICLNILWILKILCLLIVGMFLVPDHDTVIIYYTTYQSGRLFTTLYFGIMVRVFANGPWDLGSIPGRVIPKTQKIVLDAILLNTQHYKVLSRVKWSNPGKGVAPSPTPRCSSYRKGILRVTLDYGHQLYLLTSGMYIIYVKNLFICKWTALDFLPFINWENIITYNNANIDF